MNVYSFFILQHYTQITQWCFFPCANGGYIFPTVQMAATFFRLCKWRLHFSDCANGGYIFQSRFNRSLHTVASLHDAQKYICMVRCETDDSDNCYLLNGKKLDDGNNCHLLNGDLKRNAHTTHFTTLHLRSTARRTFSTVAIPLWVADKWCLVMAQLSGATI